ISMDGHGLAPAIIGHLADRYGSRLDEVLDLVAVDRRLGDPIVAGLPDPRAEIVAAVEHEWGMTVEDVLVRRTHVALRDPAAGATAASEVATLMAAHLGWDREAARTAAEAYVEAAKAGPRRWR